MTKSYKKGSFSIAAGCEQAGVTGDRTGHKQHGEQMWFSWINSTWQRWHPQSGSRRCTAAMTEDARRRQTAPLTVSHLIWCFHPFFPPLYLFYTASLFLLLFLPCITFTAPLIICQCLRYSLSKFWHYYFPNFTVLSIFLSFFLSASLYFPSLHLPLSLCLCQPCIHLHCVKGYRVHSSGTLMLVPLS